MVELTQDFAGTVKARIASDEVFRAALKNEIARLRLLSDSETAEALLLDLVKIDLHLAVRPQAG